jgi:sphingoid base N-palmitoyltransferase
LLADAIPYCALFETKRKDLWATMLHHWVTVALIGYSYATGLTKVGVVIMFLHDVTDPLLEAAKLTKYARSPEFVTNGVFVLFLLGWFATRVFYYPLWVIRSVLWECWDAVLGRPEVTQFPHWHLFSALLICLWVLHLFWTTTIVKIAVTALTQGSAEDPREENEKNEKKQH